MERISPCLWFDNQAEEAAEFYTSLFPDSKIPEAVSFQIHVGDQAEVDSLTAALIEGGEQGPCGWVKDRFGLSWEVTPVRLLELGMDPDPARAARATAAMMTMQKIDIAALEAAADASA